MIHLVCRNGLPRTYLFLGILFLPLSLLLNVPQAGAEDLETLFADPPASASPWVFWYWMKGAISREGITADLEAMHEAGIGGAYLMPIKGPTQPPLMEPAVVQLTPAWWEMVRHAMREADRLGLELAMHACDGFALAGGPWITPELSMQKVVWSLIDIDGERELDRVLPQGETNEGYYQDIAVLAFPSMPGTGHSTKTVVPKVSTSLPGVDASFLAGGQQDNRVRMDRPGWIQYSFDDPFLCRSISITPDGNNFQAHRLLLQASDDGHAFRTVCRLTPPRHGWQNGSGQVTHSIEPTTAPYFRFVYDNEGSEPGSEDLDSAKWSPVLKVRRIELSSEPCIDQYRGKAGEVWRVGRRTTSKVVPDKDCVSLEQLVDLTDRLDEQGRLKWEVPDGHWTILRLGHTSTGSRNETGGGGKGLECDKLNPEAVRLQFDRWFGEVIRQVGPKLAGRVLKVFHVDSWECGSQNWTSQLREEFTKRRGYDPLPYMPTVAGIPVESADVSERFLHDLRQTVSELMTETFFGTMAELAHQNGCRFSAECVAPTMFCDGMRHFAEVDVPMGEFWLRSPTHDKPNDMRDAISAAHVYGKPVVQAEAFTQLRMDWNEHPAALKSLGDRQYCLGINRLVYHVFTHNPWLDRRPGMTLDNIGLLFQRDQTWWKPGRAWVDYARRCQALLQVGKPVVDVAVFTGEEIPRRAVLPERLVNTLPGLIGTAAIEREATRLENRGVPTRVLPRGVRHSANMTDPADWIDPLRGYAYDSVNRDALLRLARVQGNNLEIPGGSAYGLLVVPASRPMSPAADLMTPEMIRRINDLVQAGANVLFCEPPRKSPSLVGFPECDQQLGEIVQRLGLAEIDGLTNSEQLPLTAVGKGQMIQGPLTVDSMSELGIEPDFLATTDAGSRAKGIGWNHRRTADVDIYFVSNQCDQETTLYLSLRVAGKIPEIWNPVTGEHAQANTWHVAEGRTIVPVHLAPSGSLFLVFCEPTERHSDSAGPNWIRPKPVQQLTGPWQVEFDQVSSPPESVEFLELTDWTSRPEDSIRFFSGTAVYRCSFDWQGDPAAGLRYWLDLGDVADLAAVSVNGIDCGVAWTAPYRVEVTKALRAGQNELAIEVTNTWGNRLIGDQLQPKESRQTWTTSTLLPETNSLREAGLLGPVELVSQ